MLPRLRNNDLLKWKNQRRRKPLLLDGARQVGKTYLFTELFGKKEFQRVHRLDFRLDPTLDQLFEETLNPKSIIEKIELHLDVNIDLMHDLVFFDEVGECQGAVDSLKYFAEDFPFAFICATGSNIGLLESFPVGSVHHSELHPLCFEEFLMAKQNSKLLESFQERRDNQIVFTQLWSTLLEYYFVGGMPEAVGHWFDDQSRLVERIGNVPGVHRGLVNGYRQDFGKYAGRLNAQHIDSVFSSVPRQLSASQNESVKRFKFKDVIERKKRYQDLRGPIEWLEKAKLVLKCFPIEGRPRSPLQSQVRANIFKLYFCDIGVLGHMLDISYQSQMSQRYQYKGYIAENFVQMELSARSKYPTYSWQQARAEIEFIHQCQDGTIIPIEVKSGSRTKARSMRAYIERYDPPHAVKLAAKRVETRSPLEIWPLYDAQFICEL